jgi:hypothetical protein
MRKVILICSFLAIAATNVFAKEDSARYCISFTPQYIGNSALKLGFDLRLSKNNWIGISPEFYQGIIFGSTTKSNTSNYSDSLLGFGITIEDRYFTDKNKQYQGWYMKYGANYSRFAIEFADLTWQPYYKNGNTYYDLATTHGSMLINKYSGFLGFGYVLSINEVFRADIFLGLGVSQADYKTNLEGYRQYEKSFYDFQYSGAYPVITVAIGYVFQ